MTAWYVLKTQPQKEMSVEELLRRPGLKQSLSVVDVYCPVETYSIRARGRRHPIVRGRPLVRGYLFAFCRDPYAISSSLKNRGVKGVLLSIGSRYPAIIHESAMHAIKIQEWEIANNKVRKGKGLSKRQAPVLSVGDMVSIPHLGFNVPNVAVEAIVGNKIEVTVPMLGANRMVTVGIDQLELA